MAKTKYDDPRCDHDDTSVRVSNESQKDDYQPDKPLRMARICQRPECIIDALAWVSRGTGERAWWAPSGGEWRTSMPESHDSETGVTP